MVALGSAKHSSHTFVSFLITVAVADGLPITWDGSVVHHARTGLSSSGILSRFSFLVALGPRANSQVVLPCRKTGRERKEASGTAGCCAGSRTEPDGPRDSP